MPINSPSVVALITVICSSIAFLSLLNSVMPSNVAESAALARDVINDAVHGSVISDLPNSFISPVDGLKFVF